MSRYITPETANLNTPSFWSREGAVYVLVRVQVDLFCLIDVSSGNRWSDASGTPLGAFGGSAEEFKQCNRDGDLLQEPEKLPEVGSYWVSPAYELCRLVQCSDCEYVLIQEKDGHIYYHSGDTPLGAFHGNYNLFTPADRDGNKIN